MSQPGISEKPIMDHLEELRWLVLRCCGTLLVCCLIVACCFPWFAKILNFPIQWALGGTDKIPGLITTSPMGIFSVIIDVCLLGGFALALPVMLYWVVRFISPGLTQRELKALIPGSALIIGLFLIGASLSYFLVLPASVKVSAQLNELMGFELMWSATQYYALVVWMTLGVGISFEFPLVLLVLIYLEILSVAQLKSWRKGVFVGVLIAGAAITPSGDPYSLAIVSGPLYALFELSLLIGNKIERKALLREAEEY